MTEILVAIAGGAVVAFVARPLFRNSDARLDDATVADGELEKRRAFAALLDLDDDELSGKVTAEDAAKIRPYIEREAIDAIDAAPATEASRSDFDLEREIAAVARRLAAEPDES